MKIVILGDTHWGMRNDSIPFQELHEKFYQKVMFPYMLKHEINVIFQMGDLFDRRKFISFQILDRAKKNFFDYIRDKEWSFFSLVGNHDAYWRNSLEINSQNLLLGEYAYFHIISEPKTIQLGNLAIDVIPWICKDNEQTILDFINNSKSEVCFGHFELSGFEMDKGNVCVEGMSRDKLSKYEMVLSGHFHHRSTDGQIYYVGAPGEMTWADVDDVRGFHVFDTETRSLEFIQNPYKMFYKFLYDDAEDFTFEKMKTLDLSIYAGSYVKVLVASKTNPYLFETFMDLLMKADPIDITIAEAPDTSTETTDKEFEDSQDTTELLKKYVDGINFDGDKQLLYNKIHELYVEAQTLEQV